MMQKKNENSNWSNVLHLCQNHQLTPFFGVGIASHLTKRFQHFSSFCALLLHKGVHDEDEDEDSDGAAERLFIA